MMRNFIFIREIFRVLVLVLSYILVVFFGFLLIFRIFLWVVFRNIVFFFRVCKEGNVFIRELFSVFG